MSVIICYQYLNLTHKGHLSHAYASKNFEIMPYQLDESTVVYIFIKTNLDILAYLWNNMRVFFPTCF